MLLFNINIQNRLKRERESALVVATVTLVAHHFEMSLFHQMQMVPIQQMTPSEKWEALVMHLQVQQHREMQVATLQMMGIPSARDRLPTLTEEQNACSHNVYHAEGNASYHGWKCKLCGARLCYMPTRNTLQNLQMRQKEQLQRRRRSATSAAMPSTREIQLMNARVQANQDLSDRLEAETAIGMASVSGSAAIQDLARVLENLGVQQYTQYTPYTPYAQYTPYTPYYTPYTPYTPYTSYTPSPSPTHDGCHDLGQEEHSRGGDHFMDENVQLFNLAEENPDRPWGTILCSLMSRCLSLSPADLLLQQTVSFPDVCECRFQSRQEACQLRLRTWRCQHLWHCVNAPSSFMYCMELCKANKHKYTYITTTLLPRLRHMTWHDMTLHYITLHYTTLHYITLHYITCYSLPWKLQSSHVLRTSWGQRPWQIDISLSELGGPLLWMDASPAKKGQEPLNPNIFTNHIVTDRHLSWRRLLATCPKPWLIIDLLLTKTRTTTNACILLIMRTEALADWHRCIMRPLKMQDEKSYALEISEPHAEFYGIPHDCITAYILWEYPHALIWIFEVVDSHSLLQKLALFCVMELPAVKTHLQKWKD